MSISKDFTQGKIPKQLLLFTLPFMASNALQVLYSTIDMMIVGKFVGTAGLSAVAQSSQIVNFATMVCLGVSNAGQVLVSQAIGSGKKEKMNHIRCVSQKDVSEKSRLREKKVQLLKNSCTFSFAQKGFKLISY